MEVCKICNQECLLVSNHIKIHNISAEDYYKKYIKDSDGCCVICKSPTSFIGVNLGYRRYCSLRCSKSTLEYKEKVKQTNLKKYGVDNPAKAKIVKEKTMKTCLNRYGTKSPIENINVKEKYKRTCLRKYGVEYAISSESVRNKSKSTCMKKYKVDNYASSLQFINNRKLILLEKYGVDNPSNIEGYSTKVKYTKMKKYGNENYNNIGKIKKTCLDKYGVDNPMKSDIIKNKVVESKRISFYYDLFCGRLGIDIKPMFSLREFLEFKSEDKFKCNLCNSEFYFKLKNGMIPRCTSCYPKIYGKSILEKEIVQFIKSVYSNEIILENDTVALNGIELDIYIPSKKIAIEFNGLYWHSEINGKNKDYHLNKTDRCNSIGIRLIQIFEDEWINKTDIVKSRLRHILGVSNEEKIYARKCNIKVIDFNKSFEFLNKHHIQGGISSSIYLGAYYNNELISVMNFSKNRICVGNKNIVSEYELIRFCFSKNCVGIFSKLLKYFIRNYAPTKIVSYSDRRWSVGDLYEKNGFKKVSNGTPNYWYMEKYQHREHRFNYIKSKLSKKLIKFDRSLTEWQNMQLNGYDRIWDCGNLKYEISLIKL